MADDKIIRLASRNDTVPVSGDAARALVAAFLREWADAIEDGDEVTKVVLVLHNTRPDGLFRLRTRRCNVDLVETVGIMQLAVSDLCTAT